MWQNVIDVNSGIDVHIPHHNYQVKFHSFLWFSASCAAGNHCPHLHKQNESYGSKVKFREDIICSKRVLEAAKLACANKTKNNLSLARNMTLATFGELFLAFSANLIELYLVYLMALRCSLLNLISQSYLLKFFVRLLILLTKVSLYLFYHVELIWTAWYSWTFHIDWERHNQPRFLARVWLWLYFSSGSEDLSTWTFMDISWTSQYVSERILFPDCPKLSYVVPVFKNVR